MPECCDKVGEVAKVVFLCLPFTLSDVDLGVCCGKGWGDEVATNVGSINP